MTLVAFSTWPPFGSAMQHLALTTNAPLIQSSVKQGTDAYAYELSPTAGDDVTFVRVSGRAAATGIQSNLNLTDMYFQGWFRWATFPTHEEFAVLEDGADVYLASLRIRSDGIVRFHDFDDLASATATATGSVALTADNWYRIRWRANKAGLATDVLIYNEAGTLVDSFSASSVNYNTSNIGRVFLGWQISRSALSGDTQTYLGDASATFTMYFGSCLIDNAAYPDAAARVGVQMAAAEGADTGFTLGAGASKVAAVNTIPPDGNTGYIVSTVSGAAQTFTLQTLASAGITPASILGVSPFWAGWDVGGAITIGLRLIEGATTTNLTQSDPGATVDFHLRGPLYASTYPSGGALTVANVNAAEVGVVRAATTVEIRVGSIGQHVVYVPEVEEESDYPPRLSTDRLSTDRLSSERLSLSRLS